MHCSQKNKAQRVVGSPILVPIVPHCRASVTFGSWTYERMHPSECTRIQPTTLAAVHTGHHFSQAPRILQHNIDTFIIKIHDPCSFCQCIPGQRSFPAQQEKPFPPYTPPFARISHPLLHRPNQRLHDLTQGAVAGVGSCRGRPIFFVGAGKKPEVSRFLKLRIGKLGNSSMNRHQFVESIGLLQFAKRAKRVCIPFRFSMQWRPTAGRRALWVFWDPIL